MCGESKELRLPIQGGYDTISCHHWVARHFACPMAYLQRGIAGSRDAGLRPPRELQAASHRKTRARVHTCTDT